MRRTRIIVRPVYKCSRGIQGPKRSQARVYVACPKSEYAGDRYREMLAHVRQLYPGALLLEPAILFDNLEDWRHRLPGVLKQASELVFFTTLDGWIGRGVYAEIHGALAHRIPVHLLTSSGTLVSLEGVSFTGIDQENWTRFCRVSLADERQE